MVVDGLIVERIRQRPLAPNGGHDVRNYQGSISYWHELAWGDKSLIELTAKLAEESGEVARAVVRHMEGRPGGSDDEIGNQLADVFIVVCQLANKAGLDLQSVVSRRFYDDVQFRQHPAGGRVPWASLQPSPPT